MLTDKTLCAIHLIQISAGDRVIQSSNQGQMSGWAINTGSCLYKGAHFLYSIAYRPWAQTTL